MVGMPMARISRTSERCEGFGESVKLVLKSHSRRNRISEYLPQRRQGRKGNVLISVIANDGEKSKKDFSLEWK
jgi:hypothetical protein